MTVRRNNRSKWIVDIEFTHADGRDERVRKTSPVQTKEGAKQYEREVRKALLDGSYHVKTASTAPTLDDFVKDFIEWCHGERHKPTGVDSKESVLRAHLMPLFGVRRIDSFTPTDEKNLKARFKEKAQSTYNNSATALNKLLDVAKRLEKIKVVPHHFKLFKRQLGRPRFYDFDEFEWLVEAARKTDPRIEIAVLLGGEAGLRRGEIIALEWTSVDLRRGLITVERSQGIVKGKPVVTATKGLDWRVVPMTRRLLAKLKAFRHLRGSRVLYPDEGQVTITPKVFRNWMARAQKLAQLSDKGATHILRHTFCSHLAMRGAPTLAIQRLAGHKHLTTTMRYMHLSPGETNRAISLLDDRSTHVSNREPGGNMAATKVAGSSN